MGIEHSLTASLDIKPGVQLEQIRQAIKPLTDYFGWKPLEPVTIEQVRTLSSRSAALLVRDEDGSFALAFDCAGEVGHNHPERVQQVVDALCPLVYAAPVTFIDDSTGDPDARETIYWAGQGEELALAQRDHAIEEAGDHLRQGGFTKAQVESFRKFMSEMPVEKDVLSSRPRG